MISEGYRTHRGVAGPMNFKKSGSFFRKIVLPGFWGPSAAIQALELTLQTLLWPEKVRCSPYAMFQRDTEPIEVSLVR